MVSHSILTHVLSTLAHIISMMTYIYFRGVSAAVAGIAHSAPYLAGFTGSGVAAGSVAAATQSAIGNVAAGSAFSVLEARDAAFHAGGAGF